MQFNGTKLLKKWEIWKSILEKPLFSISKDMWFILFIYEIKISLLLNIETLFGVAFNTSNHFNAK